MLIIISNGDDNPSSLHEEACRAGDRHKRQDDKASEIRSRRHREPPAREKGERARFLTPWDSRARGPGSSMVTGQSGEGHGAEEELEV